jgi:tetratricopeptide (TPR) repeat protein
VTLIQCWLARGALGAAVEGALAATRANPASVRLLALLGQTRLHFGDFAGAEASIEELWSRKPTDLGVLTSLGQIGNAVNRHDLAKAAFERALDIRPGDPQLSFNLATSLRNFGELAEAEKLYDSVIRACPDDWEAYKNRSDLRTQVPDRNHIPALTAALGRARGNWRGTVMLQYALGKELEDLGNYDAAFAAFDTGAKLRRSHMDYKIEAELKRIARIQQVFDSTWVSAQEAGCQSAEPIFIFGLPRSGSTLLERMLSCHPEVFSAGELQNFGIEMLRMVRGAGAGSTDDVVAASAQLSPRKLGEAYVNSARLRTGKGTRFIDKLPGNFLYAALIAVAFPNATLIHMHRDPRDTGVGMYKTLFEQAYPFSYDLVELRQYIRAYQGLMRHWHDILPGRIIDVAYEELVDKPEGVIKAVLSRFGLPFDPSCLSFFKSTDPTSTASAVQVRQPIYRTSIGSWRRYARYLEPLIDL